MRYHLLTLVLCLGMAQAQFSDVPEDHWSEKAVSHLLELGVLVGFPDGTFQGDNPPNRYEAAVMLERLLVALEQTQFAEVWHDLNVLQVSLNDLAHQVATQNVALGAVSHTLDRLGAVETKIQALETNTPSILVLFDGLKENLVQMEMANVTNSMAMQENILTELDFRLMDYDKAMRADLASYVDTRLIEFSTVFQAQFADFTAQINSSVSDLDERVTTKTSALEAELNLQKDRLNVIQRNRDESLAQMQDDMAAFRDELAASNLPSWTGEADIAAGFHAESASYYAEITLSSSTGASAQARLEDGLIDLNADYQFNRHLSAGAYYSFRGGGSVGGISSTITSLDPIIFKVDAGYAESLDVGLSLWHDGRAASAVIRDLSVGTTARLSGTKTGRFDYYLIDARADLSFPVSKQAELSIAALYQNVSYTSDYQGFALGAGFSYQFDDDFGLSTKVSFGFFKPSNALSRAVPEGSIRLNYQDVYVSGFLDSGLPDFALRPSFVSADPSARNGLHFGLRAGVRIALEGGY